MLEWNLQEFFKDEEEIKAFLEKVKNDSIEFKNNYENHLNTLKEEEFKKALIKYENILESINKILSYAYLLFAKDSSNGSLLAKYEKECKDIEENILFFELEFCLLDENKAQSFINASLGYEYYLNYLYQNKKYNLSKKEERIMLHLSSTGANAFARLFDESFARLRIKFGDQKISEEEILSKLYDQNRSTRKLAAKSFTKALKKNIALLAYILNMIKTEQSTICKLRGYDNNEHLRHLSNHISQKSVDALINTTQKHFDLVKAFYEKKKQILGYKELKDYDRYAPIGKESEFDFKKSKNIVLKAFGSFAKEFKDIALEAFDKSWIDLYPKKNKQSGAFSHSASSDVHPFVNLNFTNQRRDLFTLAHELGHAIHQKLSYNVSFLNQSTPLTTAEMASVFAEMLVFDYLKNNSSKKDLLGLMAPKLEDIFATLYRQINFTTFERRIHASPNELSIEEINNIWLEESSKMFQGSIKLGSHYAFWWSYIPHFIHSPFYCYAYAYAQLLVLALYGLYKSGKCQNFKELYINTLKAGGSKSPKELIAVFGFDIDSEDFWELGIKEIKNMLNQFLKLKND